MASPSLKTAGTSAPLSTPGAFRRNAPPQPSSSPTIKTEFVRSRIGIPRPVAAHALRQPPLPRGCVGVQGGDDFDVARVGQGGEFGRVPAQRGEPFTVGLTRPVVQAEGGLRAELISEPPEVLAVNVRSSRAS